MRDSALAPALARFARLAPPRRPSLSACRSTCRRRTLPDAPCDTGSSEPCVSQRAVVETPAPSVPMSVRNSCVMTAIETSRLRRGHGSRTRAGPGPAIGIAVGCDPGKCPTSGPWPPRSRSMPRRLQDRLSGRGGRGGRSVSRSAGAAVSRLKHHSEARGCSGNKREVTSKRGGLPLRPRLLAPKLLGTPTNACAVSAPGGHPLGECPRLVAEQKRVSRELMAWLAGLEGFGRPSGLRLADGGLDARSLRAAPRAA
jgi:hypothetical protein